MRMDDADRSKTDNVGGRKAVKVHVAGVKRADGWQVCIRCTLPLSRVGDFAAGDNVRLIYKNGFFSESWAGPATIGEGEVKCDLFERN